MLAFSVIQKTKGTLPRVPFKRIAEEVLGPKASLSLVFISAPAARKLNKQHRNKEYTPNILTFPIRKGSGDIFLCPQAVRASRADFGLSYTNMTLFLFIHGLLHLKGSAHGATMERLEERLFQRYRR